MPPRVSSIGRRARPIALVAALVEIWGRIPPEQRRLLATQARKHGPRLASKAVKTVRARRGAVR